MPELHTFRSRRRSAAERRALLPVQRELGLIDSCSRTKYLRDFREAFRHYERLLAAGELETFAALCDILLIGDYHALASCQDFAGTLVLELRQRDERPVLLGLEPIFKRDQAILDDWQRRMISDTELRGRLHFDSQWGYAWEPFIQMLRALREHQVPLFGLDCYPRGDMRRIGTRDRHAALAIAELQARYPDAQIVALFGESHLSPQHLPAAIRARLPHARIHTILQNQDELYWRAIGESIGPPQGVRISDEVMCVFNAPPWEKYHAYREYIKQWREQSRNRTDHAPVFYDLIDALLEFLGVERYADADDFEPRYFVDLYPEVYGHNSVSEVRRLLQRKKLNEAQVGRALRMLMEGKSYYLPERNVLLCFALRLQSASEAAASFVHHACRRLNETELPWEESGEGKEDGFYRKAIEYGLVDFGSRVLYSARPLALEQELLAAYSASAEEIEEAECMSARDYLETVDFLLLHRDLELYEHRYAQRPALLKRFIRNKSLESLDFAARKLGTLFGSDLYQAYIEGDLPKRWVRSLFFKSLAGVGRARAIYFNAAQKARKPSPAARIAA